MSDYPTGWFLLPSAKLPHFFKKQHRTSICGSFERGIGCFPMAVPEQWASEGKACAECQAEVRRIKDGAA